MEMSRRNLGTLFWVLLIALIALQTARVHTAHVALRNLKDASAAVAAVETEYQASVRELTEARQRHLVSYLAGYSTDKADTELASAKEAIAQASSAKKPRLRNHFAKTALQHARAVKSNAGWHDEIVFLDRALSSYRDEPSKLMALSVQLESGIKAFEAQGYFSSHFEKARKTNALARGNHDKAMGLLSVKFERNSPDYRSIYVACLEGERLCNDARTEMQVAPDTNRENAERIASFGSRLSLVNSRYARAAKVARELNNYPKYRMSDQIAQSYGQLDNASQLWAEARRFNSMQSQRFAEAKGALDRANAMVDQVLGDFDRAENNWATVQNAIRGIPDQRKAARSSIDRASSYASQWSENDQSETRDLINRAETQFRSGLNNQDSDPPAAIAAFSNASSLGNQAYDAVDDVDHTTSSSSWSDDDSSSSSSSSSSGSSSYGGSSYDSGGSSSYGGSGGGSYDSGPSGSYDSGPSGSYDGGGL